MKYLVTMGVMLISISGFSQQTKDPKAKAILDEVSKKTKSYSSMKADFSYTLKNTDEGLNETQKGTILVKGDKYRLSIAGQTVVCDGKTVWTIIGKDEVQINSVPDPDEEGDMINPANIFTMYEKGFKYKFVKETTLNGRSVQIINLYPEKANEKSYHTAKLTIDKAKKQIYSIKISSKDGNYYIYKLLNFKPNTPTNSSTFTVDTSKYDEVIDLR